MYEVKPTVIERQGEPQRYQCIVAGVHYSSNSPEGLAQGMMASERRFPIRVVSEEVLEAKGGLRAVNPFEAERMTATLEGRQFLDDFLL